MKNSTRYDQDTDRSNAAMTFLERVRSRFPDAAILGTLDRCLAEYQEALIALLLAEVLSEDSKDQRKSAPAAQLTHSQQVIADAQTFEQYQQTLVTHLEARQRLKAVLRQLHALLQNQLPASVGT